jgi:hypothetical protein
MDETHGSTEFELFDPELFRYEAFEAGGLTSALHALEKLSRLLNLAQRGLRATEQCVGDDVLLIELAEAVENATSSVRHKWEKGEVRAEGDIGEKIGGE